MISIRPYHPDDAEALRSLYLNERRSTFTWVDPENFKLTDFDEQTEGETILVAVEGKLVVGFISVWIEDDFIHHLYIARGFQEKGIGIRLLNAALPMLGAVARLKCLVLNFKADAFYRKYGFIEMGRGVSAQGEYILFEKINHPGSTG